MSQRISAIICTHNRSAYLRKAISSLVAQTLPIEEYEVIVVDNASTDNTRAVVDAFAGAPNLRYIHEPVLGLSQARNTGWRSAKGEYVAFLDDDAMACAEWLERILQAFETVQPQPGAVGGKVVPIWENPRPDWLPKEVEPSLTIIDWSPDPLFLTEAHQFLAGVNVAYPRRLLVSAGGFSTELGRKGANLLSSEEYLIERYLRRSALGVYYDPRIAVQHHIPAQRLTAKWLCRRYFWQGASFQMIQLLETSPGMSRRHYLGGAICNLVRFAGSPANLVSLLVPAGSQSRVKNRCSAYGQLGGIWYQVLIGIGKVKNEH